MKTIVISDYTFDEGTCDLVEINGPFPGIETPIYHMRFCTEDSCNPWQNCPCVVPDSEGSTSYSFAKTIFFRVNDWEDFSHKIGCNSVISVGCCANRKPDTDMNSSEIVASQRPVKRHEYTLAQGSVGKTGDPIKPCSNLMDFSQNFPYIIASGPFCTPFSTDCMIAQMKISYSALPREIILPNIQIIGVVE